MALPKISQNGPWAWFARGASGGLPTIAQNAPWLWAVQADTNGNPITANYYFNIVDYGAIQGDVNTWKVVNTTAIVNALIDAAIVGGVVYFPPGTWRSKLVDLSGASNVTIMGAGAGASIWKLADSENTDLASAYVSSINLTGTNGTGPSTALSGFSLKFITLDGNYLNQSGTSYVLRMYAYGDRFEEVIIQNGLSGGILRDYYGPFPTNHQIEYKWSRISLMDNQGESLGLGGSSDGMISELVVANNANVGSNLVHVYQNATGLQVDLAHLWRSSPFQMACGLLVEGPCTWSNSEVESIDTVCIVVLNDRFVWNGGRIFSGSRACSGIQIGQFSSGTINSNITTSPVTLSTNLSKINYACTLQFAITGGSYTAGNIAISGNNQLNTATSENIVMAADGTYTSVNAYSGTPTITITGVTGYSINVTGIGLAWPNTTSANATAGNTRTSQPTNYSIKSFLHDFVNFGIIFANDGCGDIDLHIQQTSGKLMLGAPGTFTRALITQNGLTNDGTIATAGMTQLVHKASLAFQITDRNNVILNVNTSAKHLDLAQGASLFQYSDNLNTLVQSLQGGTICRFPSSAVATPASNGTITTASVGIARVNPASNVTGIILGVGTIAGQLVSVQNQSAFWLQMAASGTSHVASGVSDYIAPNSEALYEWDTGGSLWYRINPPNNVQPIALEVGEPSSLAFATTEIAGRAYFVPYVLNVPVTISKMRTLLSGAPTGNIDMGIYDATGTNNAPNNLLGHTGAIAATTGTFTQNLIANLVLFPGQYWLAWIDTVADSVALKNTNANLGVQMASSSTVLTSLPNPASTVANSGFRIFTTALILNGWS